jgi:hypothetical protein
MKAKGRGERIQWGEWLDVSSYCVLGVLGVLSIGNLQGKYELCTCNSHAYPYLALYYY